MKEQENLGLLETVDRRREQEKNISIRGQEAGEPVKPQIGDPGTQCLTKA